MTVPYTSYEAKIVDALANLIAGSATFRTLVGAATPTIARGSIIELDGGMSEGTPRACAGTGALINLATAAGWAHLAPEPTDLDPLAVGWLCWSKGGTVAVHLWMRATTGDTPPERRRRALNTLGLIRAEIEAQLGAAIVGGKVASRLDALDDVGWSRDLDRGTLTITWNDLGRS
jgi:hypothetical protein